MQIHALDMAHKYAIGAYLEGSSAQQWMTSRRHVNLSSRALDMAHNYVIGAYLEGRNARQWVTSKRPQKFKIDTSRDTFRIFNKKKELTRKRKRST